MKLKIKVNPLAIKDIKEIKNYIREENVNAIIGFKKRILASI